MTSFYLNYPFKDVVLKYSHILQYWGVRTQEFWGHTTQSIIATVFSWLYHGNSLLHFLSASFPYSPKAHCSLSSQNEFSEVHIISHHFCAENARLRPRMKCACRSTGTIWPQLCTTLRLPICLPFSLHQLPWTSVVSANIPSLFWGIWAMLFFPLGKFFQSFMAGFFGSSPQ